MRLLLRTPGLQRLLGRSLALVTFTGRRTGNRYSIPVSYRRTDGEVTVLTRRSRSWWRNFETPRPIEVRLAGTNVRGRAGAVVGEDIGLDDLRASLAGRPVDARAFGVELDDGGRPGDDDLVALRPGLVQIRIALDD